MFLFVFLFCFGFFFFGFCFFGFFYLFIYLFLRSGWGNSEKFIVTSRLEAVKIVLFTEIWRESFRLFIDDEAKSTADLTLGIRACSRLNYNCRLKTKNYSSLNIFLNPRVENFSKLLGFDVYWRHQKRKHLPLFKWRWEETKLWKCIDRAQVGGNRVLKAQQVEGSELIIEIQIRRKLISTALPTITLQMKENAYKRGVRPPREISGDRWKAAIRLHIALSSGLAPDCPG